MNKKVVILGGYGSFGSLISDRLVNSGAEVIVAGRNDRQGRAFAKTIRARFVRCDTSDEVSLRETVTGAYLVVNATGPYPAGDYSIPRICIEEKCNYIDLADGREYVKNFHTLDRLAKENSVFACSGASTTPAITSILMDELLKEIGKAREIKIAMSPGTKNPAGVATFESILSYVGKPIKIWKEGTWEERRGWGDAEMVHFPQPIGRRRVQLCDIPDLDIFPQHYKANTVIFKAGVELTILNIALEFLGRMRGLFPRMDLPKLTRLLIFGSNFFRPFGTSAGGLQIWVTDSLGGQKSMAVVAPHNGPRIPSSPAALMAKKLLKGEIPAYGAFLCMGYINLNELTEYLSPFGITIQKVK